MRLLILTQSVDQDDSALGFFHRWIEEFARNCERVIVVCLREGRHSLPGNVTVLSLGKEKQVKAGGKNAPKVFSGIFPARLVYLLRFFSYIWKYRRQYDAVFVHMNQIYVLLGSPFWRLWGKRVCLWYAHGAVSLSLRLAERGAHAIVTSTSEGFRLPSRKLHVVGQGIDTAQFASRAKNFQQNYCLDAIRIVYVGRIALVKRCDILITVAGLLHAQGERFSVTFVGDTTAPPARAYHSSLMARVRELGIGGQVTFVGAVPHNEVVRHLRSADVFVNPSETGSLDKAGLEALAAGVPVITCNEAFMHTLGAYGNRLMFPKGDAHALADCIIVLHRAPDRQAIAATLAAKVRQEHSLEALIPRILSVIGAISA